MTKKKYIGFSVEDLLHDQDFVSTVKGISNPEELEQFLQLHHGSKSNMIQAQKIIELFQTKDGVIPEEKKQQLWSNIYKLDVESSENYKRTIRIRTFIRIAASILIILSLGNILYLHLNRVESQYQFSESHTDLKSDNSFLVLSDGNTVELESKESKITVLNGQNAIQINNDQIIENKSGSDITTNDSKFNEVVVPFGKKSKLILEDGTIVWLNAGSRFAFPQKFNERKREVSLDGEACFEVAKNDKKPFIVSTGELSIEVLGTIFNVCAYSSDKFTETVLVEGSVNIWDNRKFFKDKILMIPNQKATYNKTEKDIVLKPELESGKYIAWIDGWYQFTNEDIDQILTKLERYYNVNFEYTEITRSRTFPVSGKLDLKESLNDVLLVLSRVAKFEYQISGEIVIIGNDTKK